MVSSKDAPEKVTRGNYSSFTRQAAYLTSVRFLDHLGTGRELLQFENSNECFKNISRAQRIPVTIKI